jgi:carbon monoxide dehydrogenase subunit G
MLRFEGDKDFLQAPAELWSKLTDARFLVECVPGVESVSQSEPSKVTCTLRPGFAFVRGTLDLSLEVVDSVKDASARVLLTTKGIGSTSAVEATLSMIPQGSATRVHWTAEIKELGGLLKAVPQGLVKAAAQKVIADALATVEAKLKA